MSKKNRKLHPKKQKYKNLKYQIKEVELVRLEKANVPMLMQTEKQYRNHAIKFANWCKEQYGCRTLANAVRTFKIMQIFSSRKAGRHRRFIHTWLVSAEFAAYRWRIFRNPYES